MIKLTSSGGSDGVSNINREHAAPKIRTLFKTIIKIGWLIKH
jgi:hypothetical protein